MKYIKVLKRFNPKNKVKIFNKKLNKNRIKECKKHSAKKMNNHLKKKLIILIKKIKKIATQQNLN